jgi:hypothetical protein
VSSGPWLRFRLLLLTGVVAMRGWGLFVVAIAAHQPLHISN